MIRKYFVLLMCIIQFAVAASLAQSPVPQISDEKDAVLEWDCSSGEQPPLELWLNRVVEIRISESPELHDPNTHDVPLNTAINVVSGKNGQVLLHEGDVNDTAPSARIVFRGLKPGKVWGEYDIALRDARWRGLFVAKRRKHDPCAYSVNANLLPPFPQHLAGEEKTAELGSPKPVRVVSIRFGEWSGWRCPSKLRMDGSVSSWR